MTRDLKLLAFAAVAVLALGAGQASAKKYKGGGNTDTAYKVKFTGTQVTTWSYDYTDVDPIGCTHVYQGKGSERYDFTSPKSKAVLRTFKGQPSFEVGKPTLSVLRSVDGASGYTNSGPEYCAHSSFKTDDDGCGKHSGPGAYSVLAHKGSFDVSLSDDYFHMTCPSAASGGTDEAGGHGLETSSAPVNIGSLIKSKSKRIQGEKTVKKDIKYGNKKIGEEATTLKWTFAPPARGQDHAVLARQATASEAGPEAPPLTSP
jgi:hypothetical protein